MPASTGQARLWQFVPQSFLKSAKSGGFMAITLTFTEVSVSQLSAGTPWDAGTGVSLSIRKQRNNSEGSKTLSQHELPVPDELPPTSVGGKGTKKNPGFSRKKTMPHVKVWIHFVWTTKNRLPMLSDDIRQRVFQHIRENARDKGIFLDFINGWREHVHCLISLGTEQRISEIVKLLKGESSHWINRQKLCSTKFQWQHEYFAVGVCESILDKTRDYIKNQEAHHTNKPFGEEFDAMLKKYGFQRFKDDDA